MSCAQQYDLNICKGVTSAWSFRSAQTPYKYKAITNITAAAPCVITATSHQVPDQWPVAIVGPIGMDELQAKRNPPQGTDWKIATYSDANTIELNDVNAIDYTAYVSGGKLQYFTPTDLSTVTNVKFIVYNEEGGTALLTYTSSPANNITVDTANYYIHVTVPATETITWTEGYYRLTLHYADGTVTPVLEGTITVEG